MRSVLVLTVGLLAAACGDEIGDECIVSSDCDPDGTRICDTEQPGGYCTIQGCDWNTCPEESICVRFFTGGFENKPCQAQSECTLDELCSLEGLCVPRSSESRFCMRSCESNDDCRDGYECRDLEKMIANGGEPVLEPGKVIDERVPRFCAVAP